jgi:hypothetical protein
MTGPQNYTEAERLVSVVTKPSAVHPAHRVLEPGDHRDVLLLALVHAVQGLAAATALSRRPTADAEHDAWREVTA